MKNLEYILTKNKVKEIIRKGEGFLIDPKTVSLYGKEYRYEKIILDGKHLKQYIRTDKINEIAKKHNIYLF